jgi:hypothetical protein
MDELFNLLGPSVATYHKVNVDPNWALLHIRN